MKHLRSALLVAALVAALALGLRSGFGGLVGEPSLEQRTRFVAQQLRCPVCTGQSVAESDSTVAIEMRNEIREKLAQGVPPEDILANFEARYGAWIINEPPRAGLYWLVWTSPFVAAAGGVWLLGRYVAGQRPSGAKADSKADDQADAHATTPAVALPDDADDEVATRLHDYL